MAKSGKAKAKKRIDLRKRKLFYISLAILLVKVVIILSIKFGGFLGSDAEGYVAGAASMLKIGFFAKDNVLSFLPAGYPILIWFLSLLTHTGSSITNGSSLAVLSLFQSLFYFLACAYFAEKIRSTRLHRFAVPTALFLGLNPTLSLSSLVAGYESIVASCMLLSVALILDYRQNPDKRSLLKVSVLVGLLQSFSGMTQPREMLLGFSLLVLWGLFEKSRKTFAMILIVGSLATSVLPFVLVARNYVATGSIVLSQQLGATMGGGAGDGATGGYLGRGFITCPPKPNGEKTTDNELVGCVLDWYAHHPAKTVKLIVNKTIFFWSPWSGPLANGTAARNPWLKFDPILNIITTPGGRSLVLGGFGKAISWIWLLGGLFLLARGFMWLWFQKGLEREFALLLSIPVLLATLISVGTIGDHRYRIPTMGLSLFLQIVGFVALKERVFGGPNRATLETKGRAR